MMMMIKLRGSGSVTEFRREAGQAAARARGVRVFNLFVYLSTRREHHLVKFRAELTKPISEIKETSRLT